MALLAALSTGFGLHSLNRVWPLGDLLPSEKVRAAVVPCVLLVIALALWVVSYGAVRGSFIAFFVASLAAILIVFVRQYIDRRT